MGDMATCDIYEAYVYIQHPICVHTTHLTFRQNPSHLRRHHQNPRTRPHPGRRTLPELCLNSAVCLQVTHRRYPTSNLTTTFSRIRPEHRTSVGPKSPQNPEHCSAPLALALPPPAPPPHRHRTPSPRRGRAAHTSSWAQRSVSPFPPHSASSSSIRPWHSPSGTLPIISWHNTLAFDHDLAKKRTTTGKRRPHPPITHLTFKV